MADSVLSAGELLALGSYVSDRWTAGAAADWSAPAGTLEWSCTATADHAVDCVSAAATFLTSRRIDRYPDMPIFTSGPDATMQQLVESLEVMCRLVVDVVGGAPRDVRAVLFAGPEPLIGVPPDFVLRAGLEPVLHAHDVCVGLGVDDEPDVDLAGRIRNHTCQWPMWKQEFGAAVTDTNDPLGDLRRAITRTTSRLSPARCMRSGVP